MKRIFIISLMLIFSMALCVCAQEKISPAIDIIANESSMVKAGVLYDSTLGFDVGDFDLCLGKNVETITVSSLPDASLGRLILGNLYVVENQVIFRDDFSMLKFVSKTNDTPLAVFKFKPDHMSYEIECRLMGLEQINLSPVASNGEALDVFARTDSSFFGTLEGYDHENDAICFQITAYPQKGLVSLVNANTGDYRYTPYQSSRGTDVFKYRVFDCYGNYSEEATVKVKIEKSRSTLVFSDVDDKYLLPVTLICEEGIMSGAFNPDGTLSFSSELEITREEFVVLLMKSMGAKNVPTLEKTRFADDDEIKGEYKGYIECAVSLGIIKGISKSDGLYFNPKGNITVSEAAVIINKIIGAKGKPLSTFLDSEDVPSWAKNDVEALCELGILQRVNGKINPNNALTRAQTARILTSLLELRGKIGK